MKVQQPPPYSEVSRPALVFAHLICILAVLMSFLPGCDTRNEKKAIIDFSDRVQTAHDPSRSGAEPLRIALAAVISPKETATYYDSMMRYVGRKFGRPVEIIQRKTYQEINDLLELQRLDAAFVCAGPYVTGHKKFGMELLVAPMLYGKAFYQAYVIVPAGSPITGLAGLRGKRFAFTDPQSNTGALVPRYLLSRMGETPESFFKSFIYTYSHDNSIRAVAKGIVDGASVDGLIWEYYREKQPEMVSSTTVVFRSPLYGIPPVVVHPKTPQEVKDRLRQIFLGMHTDPEGRKILRELKIEKFVVPKDASYDSVREMEQWLQRR